MTSFKRFENTPVEKYEYIALAVPIVLPHHMFFMNEVPDVIE